MGMVHAEQKQEMYEVNSVEEVQLLVARLLEGGTWNDEELPTNIMNISIIPHQEVGPRIAGAMMVAVIYVALE